MTIALSKSNHVAGLQCPLLLWTRVHRRDRIPPPDEATRRIFEAGHEVGRLAQRIAPGGEEVPFGRMMATVEATGRLLSARRPIYEASFIGRGVYCRVDILRPSRRRADGRMADDPAHGDAWDLMEVKSTTRVKDVHLHDIAVQDLCLRAAGIAVDRLFLVHLDRSYRRRGAVDPHGLFHAEDVTARVRALADDLEEAVARAFRVIEGPEPTVPIGPHCDEPYECPLKPRCWAHLPDHAATTLVRAGRGAFDWMERGWVRVVDVPDPELGDAQLVQKRAVAAGGPLVDRASLRTWLQGLQPPLLFLDFEAFAPAVPVLDGTGPYEDVPFQASVHVVEGWEEFARWVEGDADAVSARDSGFSHLEFLATSPDDPRPALVDFLAALPSTGSVVAWHGSYERRILERLAEWAASAGVGASAEWGASAETGASSGASAPTDAPASTVPYKTAALRSLADRLVDLEEPFRRLALYHPEQRGSTSIKAVLPAWTGRGYEGDAVADGRAAAAEYLRVIHGEVDPTERARVLEALRSYCRKDTWSMVEMLAVVRREAVGEG